MSELLARVRREMVEMEYNKDTIQTYTRWMVQYILFHKLQHPAELGRDGVEAFINHLAVRRRVAAGTQNQALSALVVLYKVLGQPLDLTDLRARGRRRSVPETASRHEITDVLDRLTGRNWLMATLVYGAGLTISECAKLRISQVDFETNSIIIRDKITVLPEMGRTELRQQMAIAKGWPGNVDGYVFPSGRMHQGRCWHVSPSSLQKAVKKAGVDYKRITPKVMRASFGRHLLDKGYDIRTVQGVLGYRSVKSAMRLRRGPQAQSPLDLLVESAEKTAER
jgi:site-specific recombinase XerD